MVAGLQCSGWGYDAAPLAANARAPKSVPLPPSNLPQLNGSAECRDLILLGPSISARDLLPTSFLPRDAKAHYLTARSKRLASYAYHIPCRAGSSMALDSAVACVAAALREFSAHEAPPWTFACSAKSLSLYGLALQSLHAALEDAKLSVAAETLCATELLGLFEVQF